MTEDEAKTKICPVYQVGNQIFMALHDAQMPDFPYCIGSACMMWIVTDNECLPQAPGDTTPARCYPSGYCGLAR